MPAGGVGEGKHMTWPGLDRCDIIRFIDKGKTLSLITSNHKFSEDPQSTES